jgi:hypothetical protein
MNGGRVTVDCERLPGFFPQRRGTGWTYLVGEGRRGLKTERVM